MAVGYVAASALGGQTETAHFAGGAGCHPSYTGACLISNASDYDCGGGDGPYYTGRVTIVGPDVFSLDGNRDGIGCN